MVEDFDTKVAAIALAQHSVVTWEDVVAIEGKAHHVKARVDAGRWIRVYEGVYRLAGASWTFHGKVLAAIKAAGDGAVASHCCAARLHGFDFAKASVEISIPRTSGFRAADVIVHTSRDLGKCKTVTCDGIPVTDVARTLLDIGAKLKSPAARASAVKKARRAKLVDWPELITCVAVHARRGRRGIRRMRELIAAGMDKDAITETDSELIAVALLREYGFEDFVTHHVVRDRDGEIVADMDIAFLDQKRNLEIDGAVHLEPEVKQKDESRDFALREYYDWKVRRVWWEIPVYQPRKFIEIVRQTLATPSIGDAEVGRPELSITKSDLGGAVSRV